MWFWEEKGGKGGNGLNRLFFIFVVAAGTYLIRFLPLIWKKKTNSAFFGEFLDHAASALLAALFVTAFVEFPLRIHDLEIKSLALVPVFFSYLRWKNLGLSVVLGVLAHFLLSQFT